MLSNNNITVVKWCQPLIVLKICKMSNDNQEFKDSIFIFSTILNCIGYNITNYIGMNGKIQDKYLAEEIINENYLLWKKYQN